MQFKCPGCGAILSSDSVEAGMKVPCPECGVEIECRPYVTVPKLAVVQDADGASDAGDLSDAIHSKLSSAIGIEKLKGFSVSELFSEVFSRHSRDEVESIFAIGTAKTTPEIGEVKASWPKPWIFTRMMLISLVLYFLLFIGWKQWENTKLLPGLMFIGSFAIPFSTLILFFELNVRKNLSMYMLVRLAFVGGIVSLLITHMLPWVPQFLGLLFPDWSDFLGASVAGPIEESAKVLAMVIVAGTVRYRHKLNGLMIGAAVGTGFAAFESAGYAFDVLFQTRSVSEMVEVIHMRGLLSPFCHIVWSAIAGCALWRVTNGRKFHWRMLCEERFIRLLLVPVVLHMIWNSPLQLPYCGTCLILGVVGWLVCLSLVQEGLHEVAAEQQSANGGEVK